MAVSFDFFLILLVCFFASAAVAVDSEGKTLLSLLKHWTVVPSSLKFSWNASNSGPCSWVGVQCDRSHRFVVALNLSSYGISGRFGPEIAHLKRLRSLDLDFNNFYGSIPPELGNCSLLEELNLSYNSFTGTIPENLGNLENLWYINLYQNSLTGFIPESLFVIPFLDTVYLNSNGLTGTIPSNIGNATQLLYLWLYENQLPFLPQLVIALLCKSFI